jgi:hypothetical protein
MISSAPALGTELHLSAIYLNSRKALILGEILNIYELLRKYRYWQELKPELGQIRD